MDKKLNRIKVILADRGLTNKWLAETIHRDPATISKWVTNASQPTNGNFYADSKNSGG